MTWAFRLVLGLTLLAWLGGVGVCPSAFASGMQEIVALLQADPRNVAALNAWGIEQARVGDLIGAIRTWRHAIDIAPDYVHLYNNIGSALRRLGHADASLAWYQASLRVQPTYWTWFNLGLLHEDGRKWEEARAAYREALRLCASFTQAEERLWRLNRIADEAAAKPPVALALPPVTPEPVRTSPPPSPRPPTPKMRPKPESTSVAKPAPTPVDELETPPMEQVRLPGDDGGQVFLTFDGGADADGLVPILEALRGRGLKSTFFLTGQWVKSYPDLARRILAEGHEIANHSMRHPDMAGWGQEKIADELGKAEEAMKAVTGRGYARFFRFPFGAQNRRVEAIVEELGYKPVYWNIDTLDWKEPSVASIQQRVRSRVRRGSVILLHVGGRNGPKALPRMLDELLARGFRPGRLSDLDPAGIAALPRG
ncbi:MAG TPA: polysaccharide deacetylase family protein [Candidatus Ozemobacteraceae bacterium]|nr:polysaccharide deacetylase family protein [Candidatus Ozemobacteraceae bacterium]